MGVSHNKMRAQRCVFLPLNWKRFELGTRNIYFETIPERILLQNIVFSKPINKIGDECQSVSSVIRLNCGLAYVMLTVCRTAFDCDTIVKEELTAQPIGYYHK